MAEGATGYLLFFIACAVVVLLLLKTSCGIDYDEGNDAYGKIPTPSGWQCCRCHHLLRHIKTKEFICEVGHFGDRPMPHRPSACYRVGSFTHRSTDEGGL